MFQRNNFLLPILFVLLFFLNSQELYIAIIFDKLNPNFVGNFLTVLSSLKIIIRKLLRTSKSNLISLMLKYKFYYNHYYMLSRLIVSLKSMIIVREDHYYFLNILILMIIIYH